MNDNEKYTESHDFSRVLNGVVTIILSPLTDILLNGDIMI